MEELPGVTSRPTDPDTPLKTCYDCALLCNRDWRPSIRALDMESSGPAPGAMIEIAGVERVLRGPPWRPSRGSRKHQLEPSMSWFANTRVTAPNADLAHPLRFALGRCLEFRARDGPISLQSRRDA